jgi:DNA-directed RNA polymerase subunit H (RpoH/RPB5)
LQLNWVKSAQLANWVSFDFQNYFINKIEHIFVPKHIVLTAEEQQQLKDEYGFKRNEIGKIKQSDPIARYYNLKPGEIIAIERPSRTSGISMYYRVCIPASLL